MIRPYITSHNGARSLIMKMERDELVEEMFKTYIEHNKWGIMTMRIMGLDYGSKTVGVAVSDPLGITAQGVETICRKRVTRTSSERPVRVSKH